MPVLCLQSEIVWLQTCSDTRGGEEQDTCKHLWESSHFSISIFTILFLKKQKPFPSFLLTFYGFETSRWGLEISWKLYRTLVISLQHWKWKLCLTGCHFKWTYCFKVFSWHHRAGKSRQEGHIGCKHSDTISRPKSPVQESESQRVITREAVQEAWSICLQVSHKQGLHRDENPDQKLVSLARQDPKLQTQWYNDLLLPCLNASLGQSL